MSVEVKQRKVSDTHFAHFYRDERFLSGALIEYIKTGVEKEDGIVVVATEAHIAELCKSLPPKMISQIRFEDANWFFKHIYQNEKLNISNFKSQMNDIIFEMKGYYKNIRMFVELVDLFCLNNRQDIAIEIENYWNQFLETQHNLVVMCSYNLKYLTQENYVDILNSHSFSTGIDDDVITVDSLCRRISAMEIKHSETRLQDNLIKEMSDLKKRLLHSSKLSDLGELSAGLSHELMNPLAIISNYSQILSMSLQEEEIPSKEFLLSQVSGIHSTVSRMSTLLKSILRYSHCDEMTVDFLVENRVRDAIEMLRPILKSKNIRLKFTAPSEPVYMHGDEGQILQVIFNLVCNARDAIVDAHKEKGGEIHIMMQSDDYHVRIYVEDNGSGIESRILENIWKPFFTTKPAGKGTGLGLPIIRKIVLNYGGSIKCKSVVDQGTVFTVELPRLAG